jgi:arsenate reductase-like glutaredoxin family protein
MLTIQEYKQSKSVKGLVEKMFEARQIAHTCHLKSKSFSEHKALGEFYTELLDYLDEFIETYQGQYGILNGYEISIQSVENALEYLEDCVKLFVVGRESLKDSHLQNIMDEIIATTYRTIYKLKFLK